MFSDEQIKIFREYIQCLKNYGAALMRGEDFQAAAFDIRCDQLLKIIKDRGWEQAFRCYLLDAPSIDIFSH